MLQQKGALKVKSNAVIRWTIYKFPGLVVDFDVQAQCYMGYLVQYCLHIFLVIILTVSLHSHPN